jgi:hypothetical protein
MARKSEYDKLADAVSKRLQEMAPENAASIDEVVANDRILSNVFGIASTTAEDYTICSTCHHPAYHGICHKCK